MIGTALVVAVVAFLGLLQLQHWRQDEAEFHKHLPGMVLSTDNLPAVIQLLNYNVAIGTLKPVPPQSPAPPAPAAKAPEPKPEPSKK